MKINYDFLAIIGCWSYFTDMLLTLKNEDELPL